MCGENYRNAGASSGHAAKVDLALAETKCVGDGGFALPSNGCLHAGGELSRTEGLGDVVVSPEFKKKYLVDNFADGTKDDDRCFVGDILEGLAELATRDPRKNKVKNDGDRALGTE